MIAPHAAAQTLPHARGRLVHGDALYLRPLAAEDIGPDTLPAARRLAALCVILGFFDMAEELMRAPGLAGELGDPTAALDATSRLFGRAVWKAALAERLRALRPFARSAWALWGRPPGGGARP